MLAHCELQIGIDCIKDVSYLKLKVHVGSTGKVGGDVSHGEK